MLLKNTYQGPLAGLNVIDFGHYYAGPMAGMLLADQGANVVRIVRPGEPELPSQQYRLLNRNKKLLTLDLKTPEGKEQALSLVEHADVVIENFRPGVMKRLGLDYASLNKINSKLIYLSLPGFASKDKQRGPIQAWEGVVAAAAGLHTKSITLRESLGFPPLYMPMPQCSIYGATHGATAIMAALLAREEHSIGSVIEVPLVDAGLAGSAANFIFDPLKVKPSTLQPDGLKPFLYSPDDTQEVQLKKLADAKKATGSPLYRCADGRWLCIWGTGGGRFTEHFHEILGIGKVLKREGYIYEPWTSGLDNNLYGELSPERAQRLRQLMEDALITRSAQEWVELLGESCLVSLVRSRHEWLELEPMLASGVFADMNNGQSAVRVPGRAVDVSGPEDSLMEGFQELEAISIDQAQDLFEKFNPVTAHQNESNRKSPKKSDLLRGLKVLDLSNIMAGPTAGYTLAQYGAEVIKVDSPASILHPFLLNVVLEANQGKRSLLVDLSTVPGQAVLRRLVSQSDLVIHNILDDTASRIGLTHKQLQALNPNIVSCQLSCFGGTYRGFWEKRLGIDYSAQAATGLMAHFGSVDDPHWNARAAAADIITGLGLAFSGLLGVYQQHRSGFAGEGRTSLVRMCNYYQLPFMIAENGVSDWGEPQGQFVLGTSQYQRIYACSDGWIYVGTNKQGSSALNKIVTGYESADEATLEAAFVKNNYAFWLEKLRIADIGCHQVLSMRNLCSHPRQVDNEEADEVASDSGRVLCWEDHPCGKTVTLKAPDWVRVGEEHSYKRLKPSPAYGQHTIEILKELNYSDDEIAELARLKVIYEYLPALGNKDAYFFEPEKQS